MEFTRRDQQLLDWFAKQEPQQVSIRLEKDELILKCKNMYLAQRYWESRYLIQEQLGLNVTVWVNDRFFDSMCRLQPKKKTNCQDVMTPVIQTKWDSSWLTANFEFYRSLRDTCTVAIHSEDEQNGYPYMAVQPFLGLEAVLCKPSSELIGKPSAFAPSVIGETKTFCIKKAIAIGGTAIEDYDFDDDKDGFTWNKKVIATYMPGHQEVVLRTENRLAWQSEVWRKRLEYLQRNLAK